MAEGEKIITTNRRAGRDYEVLERVEAGIALVGTEVKTLRTTGSITLKDSYADIRNGQIYLVGTHIQPYLQGNIYNHDPERQRKLLMHKREIIKLGQRVAEKGYTIIPLKVYFKGGKVKVLLGICKGKHSYDKRRVIKDRESKIEMQRATKEHQQG